MNKRFLNKTEFLILIVFTISFLLSNALPFPAAEIYGAVLVNGSNVSVGVNITAYDPDGILCGQFIVVNKGYYGLLSCNGDDLDSEIDEGAVSGDMITLYIGGEKAFSDINIIWQSGEYYEINISNNRPPILNPIGNQIAKSDLLFTLIIIATDPDGDNLTYYSNATIFTINPMNGVINFTPATSQIGNYSINISVTDGMLWDYEIINFTIVRGPFCGDNICNVAESCASCEIDCGTCPAVPGEEGSAGSGGETGSGGAAGSRGTGGGGGGEGAAGRAGAGDEEGDASGGRGDAGGLPIFYLCLEKWKCEEWSECLSPGIQKRKCIDWNVCGTTEDKPNETRACDYIPTCFDGIKNGYETDIDCGGPECTACEDTQECIIDSDCKSKYCNPLDVCSTPSCADGWQNQNETAVDCGGQCDPCEVRKYAKAPLIEKPEIIKLLKKEFPWLLIMIASIIISIVAAGDQGYISYINRKNMEKYREKFKRYRPFRKKLYEFLAIFAVIVLIVAFYVYTFSDCISCMYDYLWMLLASLIITPFLVSMIINHYRYYEYRKKKKEMWLEQTHRSQIKGYAKLENDLLLEIESDVRLSMHELAGDEKLRKADVFYPLFRYIYSRLSSMVKKRKKLVLLRESNELAKRMGYLIDNRAMKKAARKFPEFRSALNYMKELRTVKKDRLIETEKKLLMDIREISMPHLKIVVLSNKKLITPYNRMIDIYEYYNEKHNALDIIRHEIKTDEENFCIKIQEVTGKEQAMTMISSDSRFTSVYNRWVDLCNSYTKKNELEREDEKRATYAKKKY